MEELEQVETSLRRGLHDTEHGLLLKEKRIQELEASLEEERQLQHSSASRYVLAQAQSLRLIPQSSEVDGAQLSLSMLRLTQFLHFSILHNLLFTFYSFFLMKIFTFVLFHLVLFKLAAADLFAHFFANLGFVCRYELCYDQLRGEDDSLRLEMENLKGELSLVRAAHQAKESNFKQTEASLRSEVECTRF